MSLTLSLDRSDSIPADRAISISLTADGDCRSKAAGSKRVIEVRHVVSKRSVKLFKVGILQTILCKFFNMLCTEIEPKSVNNEAGY